MAGFREEKEFTDLAREAAQTYMADNNISQAKFAGTVGVSPSTMSEFMNHIYGGRSTDVAKKINELCRTNHGAEGRRRRVITPRQFFSFPPTSSIPL